MSIHQTLTDERGKQITYFYIPKAWANLMTVLMIFMLALLFALCFVIYKTNGKTDQTVVTTQRLLLRNQAFDEVVRNRALFLSELYQYMCDTEIRAHRTCPAEPKLYALPENYPGLVGQPEGRGLFEPNEKENEK